MPDLSSTGVGFSFPTDTPIGPGKTSAVFAIRTNVKGFRAGSTTIVGGVSTIAPDLAAGHEPSALVLFAGCFLGLAVWMGWRRWKDTCLDGWGLLRRLSRLKGPAQTIVLIQVFSLEKLRDFLASFLPILTQN
jgi:hypothetical protein